MLRGENSTWFFVSIPTFTIIASFPKNTILWTSSRNQFATVNKFCFAPIKSGLYGQFLCSSFYKLMPEENDFIRYLQKLTFKIWKGTLWPFLFEFWLYNHVSLPSHNYDVNNIFRRHNFMCNIDKCPFRIFSKKYNTIGILPKRIILTGLDFTYLHGGW